MGLNLIFHMVDGENSLIILFLLNHVIILKNLKCMLRKNMLMNKILIKVYANIKERK
jgi:hypothetical protein